MASKEMSLEQLFEKLEKSSKIDKVEKEVLKLNENGELDEF